ncbi:MATE family efflux transporter [Spirillospora sp. NPDC048911]|uniref:MATE family efflux transporter n=1 Tax=Spirillospora sp. NPDC048911 TaxID=3364527 RepID=UPI003716A06E
MLGLRVWRADPAVLRRLLGLGVPIAATYGSEAGFFSVVALIVGTFGSAALAAHTAVNQLVYIVFQISVGLSHAAFLGVSRELASGRPEAAGRIARTALICGAGVMPVVAAVCPPRGCWASPPGWRRPAPGWGCSRGSAPPLSCCCAASHGLSPSGRLSPPAEPLLAHSWEA